MAGTIRIGISGWTYRPWRGRFYPKGLPQKRELAYAAERFASIEINGTFYGAAAPRELRRLGRRDARGLRLRASRDRATSPTSCG